jgi:hypothetical protein
MEIVFGNGKGLLGKKGLDVFWFPVSGVDSKKILKENPSRFPLLYKKDMSEARIFEGEGGNPTE